MKQIRTNIFETNSSSSHVLSFNKERDSYYLQSGNSHKLFEKIINNRGELCVEFGYYDRPTKPKKLKTYSEKFNYIVQALCDQLNDLSSNRIGNILATIDDNRSSYHVDLYASLFDPTFMKTLYKLITKLGIQIDEHEFIFNRSELPLVVSNRKSLDPYATPYGTNTLMKLEMWFVNVCWLINKKEDCYNPPRTQAEIEMINVHNDEVIEIMARCILDPKAYILIGTDEAMENIAKAINLKDKDMSYISTDFIRTETEEKKKTIETFVIKSISLGEEEFVKSMKEYQEEDKEKKLNKKAKKSVTKKKC